jgi:hypothetical protein
MTADILRKRKRIQDILAFLNLKAGYGEDIGSGSIVPNVQQIIQQHMDFPGIDPDLGGIGDSSGPGGMESYGGGAGIGGY